MPYSKRVSKYMNAEELQIYEAGFSAFFNRESVWSNPHDRLEGKQFIWYRGWLDAEYRCYFKYIVSANYIVSGFFGEIVSK